MLYGVDATRLDKGIGDLVQSPNESDAGVFPFEMSGFSSGRLSFMIYAKSFDKFLELVETVRHKVNAPPAPSHQRHPLLAP